MTIVQFCYCGRANPKITWISISALVITEPSSLRLGPMDNVSPAQYDRFEAYRWHALPKQAFRKVCQLFSYSHCCYLNLNLTLGHSTKPWPAISQPYHSWIFVGKSSKKVSVSSALLACFQVGLWTSIRLGFCEFVITPIDFTLMIRFTVK